MVNFGLIFGERIADAAARAGASDVARNNAIWALVFTGNYAAYAEDKARREHETWERFRRQQEHQRRVRQEIRAIKQVGRSREQQSQNDYYRRRNKKFVRRAVVLERRLERDLASADQLEKPIRHPYRVKAELAPGTRGGDRMLAIERLDLELGGRTLARGASFALGWGERVVLVGPNGAGKTTLLRALAGEITSVVDRVHHSPSARIGLLPQVEAEPPPCITPVDVVRAASSHSETEARRFLHRFLFSGDDALTPVARLSYGERRRLSLASLVLGGVNLLLLDEPTNHLDIPSREAFEAALDSYEGAMLAVTHDRYFIERFARRVLELRGGELREVWVASSL
jgi:ATP-binding cassette subfamily F protein 3